MHAVLGRVRAANARARARDTVCRDAGAACGDDGNGNIYSERPHGPCSGARVEFTFTY